MNEFDAHIFDLDGTLADTMPQHYLSWSEVLELHGMTMDESRFYRLGGMPGHKFVELLLSEQGLHGDTQAIADEKEAHFLLSIAAINPIEPVLSTAKALHGLVPMAVATGSDRMTAGKIIDHLGIGDWFSVVVTADDVQKHKPDPETYLKAAERLNVDPKRCRAYEDTETGIKAATDAGMNVVDVRPLYTHEARAVAMANI